MTSEKTSQLWRGNKGEEMTDEVKYKVWIHIEEVDEENDHYTDIGLPEELVCLKTFEEAKDYVTNLMKIGSTS